MTDTIREQDGNLIVQLEGEIDLSRAPELRKTLLDCVARGRDVLVDLSRVSYIDSAGIASLVEALQLAGKNTIKFGLVAISAEALRVFQLARLDKVFTIHADMNAALSGAE